MQSKSVFIMVMRLFIISQEIKTNKSNYHKQHLKYITTKIKKRCVTNTPCESRLNTQISYLFFMLRAILRNISRLVSVLLLGWVLSVFGFAALISSAIAL